MPPKRRPTNDSSTSGTSNAPSGPASIKAVIILGGPSRGTRFRPLSFNVPKPLFPVAGDPLISHHVDTVSKIPGLSEILLIGFFDPALFQGFITAAESRLGIPVKYLREYQAMGTGGGLYHFRDQILRGKADYVIVLHSDVCFGFSLNEVIEFHQKNPEALATLVGKKVPRDFAKNFGCIVSNEANEVLHYAEKPETFVSETISAGIYVFSPEVFDKLGEAFDAKNQEEQTNIISLETDLFVKEAGTGRLFLYLTEGSWGQMKSAGSALSMNNLYLEQYRQNFPNKLTKAATGGPGIDGLVTIHPSAKIDPTAKIGPNVSIGPNVVIAEGVRIKNSIILDNVQVKKRSCILNSIVGWSSTVGEWSRVEGGAVNPTGDTFPVEGISKDTVTIFGEDVQVGDEVIIRNCIVLPHKELKASCRNEVIM